MAQTAIPFMQIRGGSSKGVYFRKSDLPADADTRDAVLRWVMGAYGDPRQIDGLGGANPLTSKIAVVSPSAQDGCDIDYEFIQAMVGEDRLDGTPNCGNILAGVGAFALEAGIISAAGPTAELSIFMTNSGKICDLSFALEQGRPVYEGAAEINGVLGSAAPVMCRYHDLAGALCGSLLPTGNVCDEFDGVRVTCIDNGMPVVCLRAEDFGLTGYEPPEALNQNEVLKSRLESIRLQAGRAMGLGDVIEKSVPKMSLIARPQAGGAVCTRTFIPKVCHQAIGVLGAVSVATACLFENSAVYDLATPIDMGVDMGGDTADDAGLIPMRIEHPTGFFDVELEVDKTAPELTILRAGLLRTARLISRGEVYIPVHIWTNSEISKEGL